MRLSSLLTQSLTVLFVVAYPQESHTNPESSILARQETDSEIVASYAQQGLCMYYIGNQQNKTQELASCSTYCSAQNGSDATGVGHSPPDLDSSPPVRRTWLMLIPDAKCKGPTVATDQLDPSTIFHDDNGYEYTPGTCFCNAGLATALFDIIAQGLSKLDNVICAVMTSAFESVIEIGLDLTPEAWAEKVGKTAAEDAMKAAVQGAKSFKENGGKAEDVFTNWIGDACGIPSFSFSIDDMFTNLVSASSDWGDSIGCKKTLC